MPPTLELQFCSSFKSSKARLPAEGVLPPRCASRLGPDAARWPGTGRDLGAPSNPLELRGEAGGVPLSEAASWQCCNPARSSFCRNSDIPKSAWQQSSSFSASPVKSCCLLHPPAGPDGQRAFAWSSTSQKESVLGRVGVQPSQPQVASFCFSRVPPLFSGDRRGVTTGGCGQGIAMATPVQSN